MKRHEILIKSNIKKKTEWTVFFETVTIIAEMIAMVVGYQANLSWDKTKPDGTPRKLMDSSKLHALGWNNCRSLLEGLNQIYIEWLASQT